MSPGLHRVEINALFRSHLTAPTKAFDPRQEPEGLHIFAEILATQEKEPNGPLRPSSSGAVRDRSPLP